MLKVHLIFVTKYRKPLLSGDIKNDTKDYLRDAAIIAKSHILCLETDKDHIHLLVEYPPSESVSALAGWLKQYSTFHLWKKYYTKLKTEYWKKQVFWSDEYFACSIGQVSQNTIEEYIKNQG